MVGITDDGLEDLLRQANEKKSQLEQNLTTIAASLSGEDSARTILRYCKDLGFNCSGPRSSPDCAGNSPTAMQQFSPLIDRRNAGQRPPPGPCRTGTSRRSGAWTATTSRRKPRRFPPRTSPTTTCRRHQERRLRPTMCSTSTFPTAVAAVTVILPDDRGYPRPSESHQCAGQRGPSADSETVMQCVHPHRLALRQISAANVGWLFEL